jgi:hypothetical protein
MNILPLDQRLSITNLEEVYNFWLCLAKIANELGRIDSDENEMHKESDRGEVSEFKSSARSIALRRRANRVGWSFRKAQPPPINLSSAAAALL